MLMYSLLRIKCYVLSIEAEDITYLVLLVTWTVIIVS